MNTLKLLLRSAILLTLSVNALYAQYGEPFAVSLTGIDGSSTIIANPGEQFQIEARVSPVTKGLFGFSSKFGFDPNVIEMVTEFGQPIIVRVPPLPGNPTPAGGLVAGTTDTLSMGVVASDGVGDSPVSGPILRITFRVKSTATPGDSSPLNLVNTVVSVDTLLAFGPFFGVDIPADTLRSAVVQVPPDTTGSVIDVSPTSIDYGVVLVGGSSDSTIKIKNVGNGNLVLGTLSITGTNAGEFSIFTPPIITIAPSDSTNVVIRFSPQSGGTKSATLVIPSNDPNKPSVNVPLTGAGVSPKTITVTVTDAVGNPGDLVKVKVFVELQPEATLGLSEMDIKLNIDPTVIKVAGTFIKDITTLLPSFSNFATVTNSDSTIHLIGAQGSGIALTFADLGLPGNPEAAWEIGFNVVGSPGDVSPITVNLVTSGLSTGPRGSTNTALNPVDIAVNGSFSIPVVISKTTVVAARTTLKADGADTTLITVTPRKADGSKISTTLNVSVNTTAGSVGGVTAETDSTYTAVLTASNVFETAVVKAIIAGQVAPDSAVVVYQPAPDSRFGEPFTVRLTGTDGDTTIVANPGEEFQIEARVSPVTKGLFGFSSKFGFDPNVIELVTQFGQPIIDRVPALPGNPTPAGGLVAGTTDTLSMGVVASDGVGDFPVGGPVLSITFRVKSTANPGDLSPLNLVDAVVSVDTLSVFGPFFGIDIPADTLISGMVEVIPVTTGADIDFPTRSIDFGPVQVGSSVDSTLKIKNVGNGNLVLGALSITGTNASEFSIVVPPSTTIAPSDSTNVVIRFSPSSDSAKSATLVIPSNDPDKPSVNVPLTGAGNLPSALQVSMPHITASPGELILIPIQITTPGRFAISSTEMFISYDSDVTRALEVVTAGTLTEGWELISFRHSSGILTSIDTAKVAMATPVDTLTGPGTLAFIRVSIPHTAAQGATTPLAFQRLLFNDGDPSAVTQNGSLTVVAILGDVSSNGRVGAFDASLILREVVGLITLPDPEWPHFTLSVADVSGDGTISPLDGALILRFVVGITDRFPVQAGRFPKFVSSERTIRLGEQEKLRDGYFRVPISIDEMDEVLAGKIQLTFDPSHVTVKEVLSVGLTADYLFESNIIPDRFNRGKDKIIIAFAGVKPLSGSGEVAHIILKSDTMQEDIMGSVSLEMVILNEGQIGVLIVGSEEKQTSYPDTYRLFQNFPNPSNPETTIRYYLPSSTPLTLTIYNLSGQLIRTLVDGQRSAGSHSVIWDSTDDTGNPVASGIYLYRVEADGFAQTRKLILMR